MINFLVVGDWGRRGIPEQRAVARGMAQIAARYGSSFVISTGDNFYEDGVRDINDPHWQASFNDVYDDPALNIPWYAALGNHDHQGRADAQVAYTEHDARWYMPDYYYAINKRIDTRAHAQFVFLDTTPFCRRYLPGGVEEIDSVSGASADIQKYWLRHMLGPSRSTWKIVIGHHPILSGSPFHGGMEELQAEIEPSLVRYGVQAYLSGHEHDMQHLEKEGVNHIISGAGSEYRATGAHDYTRFCRSTLGFAAITLTAEVMEIRFCDETGEVVHYHTVEPNVPDYRKAVAQA